MPEARLLQIDPAGTWLRRVNLTGTGTGPAGSALVQSQNHGTVEWWSAFPAVSLASGFTMQVVPPPVTLGAPTVVPGAVTWSAYGAAAWGPLPGGTVINPGNLVFVATDPGTPDVWYLQIQWPTPISDGWLKWFRPASAAPFILGSGTTMNWAVLGSPVVLNNYTSVIDLIPRQ